MTDQQPANCVGLAGAAAGPRTPSLDRLATAGIVSDQCYVAACPCCPSRTVVLFTSDHGDMLAAHGMVYKLPHCGCEELYHVPATLSIPGATRPGSRISALVSQIDFLPTLLEAAGVPVPTSLDERSLLAGIRKGGVSSRQRVFADCFHQGFLVRDARFKFVLNWAPRGPGRALRPGQRPGRTA